MSKVGIIANPASGKDIRRLVAYASLMSNRDKTDLVRRVILGIEFTGVAEILIMPDHYGLGSAAVSGLGSEGLRARISVLEMAVTGTQEDSTVAMVMMKSLDVGCVVTVGGDGTNRAVAKGDRSVPLVPLSTGTNNIFPVMVEATTGWHCRRHRCPTGGRLPGCALSTQAAQCHAERVRVRHGFG